MLFLDRIEVLGFKSFCDTTVLKIPSGITAVVGPNGCGKSNVVDAMNWVLGEQSAKSLRSDKMEEVIFNGSKGRKPLNLAQVTLYWKTEKSNPAAPEITIARRLFRSGESQYEMNGDLCRLKDIHAFFLNEGFDPLAYSILEQGRIETVVLSKPLERRALIEEVAGVAEFKHKKRTAQIKLAENQLQLERIRDILNEIEKQLSSLKRQAAKARRHQFLREEKSVIQQILFHRRFLQIHHELQRLSELLKRYIEEEQTAAQALQQKELVCSDLKLRLTELESQFYQGQELLHQSELQLQENQNSLQSSRQHIEELGRGITEKELDTQKLSEEAVGLSNDHAVKAEEEERLKQQIEELTQSHTGLFLQLEQKTAELASLDQQVQQLRKEILELLHSASQLKNEETRLQTQRDHLLDSLQKKETELAVASERSRKVSESIEAERAGLNRLAEEIGYLDQTEADILRQCEQFKVEWDGLQTKVQLAFKHQSELRHELQKLDAQQHSSKFYNESARSLLNLPSRRALGMLMDFIETEPQFETAVENFLADKLNYLIVNEEASALDSIDYLKQQGVGYCGFIIKNGYDPTPVILPEELRQAVGVIGSLRDLVTIREEALPAIAPFVESAIMVSDLECAQGLIKRYPDYQFVTVQGDVILSPALYAGGAKADDVPGLIAIQRERKEFALELESADQAIAVLETQVRSIQDRLDIANHELVRLREVRESKNKDRLLVQMQIDQLEKEMDREQKLIQILGEEISQLTSEKEAVVARFEQYATQLQQQTADREQRELQFQEIEQQLASAKEAQSSLQSQVHDSRILIAQLNERDRSLFSEIERLRQRIENVQSSIAENNQLIRQKKQEIGETEFACSQIETQQVQLLRNRDQQKVTLEALQRERETMAQEIASQEASVQHARNALDQIRQDRGSVEIEKARVETQREDLLTRCREEMGMELESLQLPKSEWTRLADEELKNKLTETEIKIDRLGSINMLALEEYTQTEERHRFLKTQYEDLRVSIENLLNTIQRIDETSLQRFQQALQGVQAHFQDLFQRLFNGGRAEMVMIDPENPNESGIDIHVQPPGKRLQNIHLLSGGEKTLTGISFLMALFQYHASPFCVMDEVDAALDEVNVQRFTSLISEMKEQIQFLIVTHNKRTMEAADQLYGVTMAEPGVSSVLSAKFEEAEALIEQ